MNFKKRERYNMNNIIYNLENGELFFKNSRDTAVDYNGHIIKRISTNTALDLDSCEMNFVSVWDTDEDDE